jgi:hypothetical protein
MTDWELLCICGDLKLLLKFLLIFIIYYFWLYFIKTTSNKSVMRKAYWIWICFFSQKLCFGVIWSHPTLTQSCARLRPQVPVWHFSSFISSFVQQIIIKHQLYERHGLGIDTYRSNQENRIHISYFSGENLIATPSHCRLSFSFHTIFILSFFTSAGYIHHILALHPSDTVHHYPQEWIFWLS